MIGKEKMIPSPYVAEALNRRVNIHERLKELEEELEETRDTIDELEEEIDSLESLLDNFDRDNFQSLEIAASEMDKELEKTGLSKYINADKLKAIIFEFLDLEELIIPQSVFLGLAQSINDKNHFDLLFFTYTKFYNTVIDSGEFQNRIKQSLDTGNGKGLNTFKEGDMLMSVFNSGSIIADYFKAVNKMKTSNFKDANAEFEFVLKRFLDEKTVFSDVYRMLANLGISRVTLGDYTGFIALKMAVKINPNYEFAKTQISLMKKHYKELYSEYIVNKKLKEKKTKTKIGEKVYLNIPTTLDKYFAFLLRLGIDFSAK